MSKTKIKISLFLPRLVQLLVLAIPHSLAFAQQAVVIGLVRDAQTRKSMPGAHVVYSGSQGAFTDAEGRYKINLEPGRYLLTFRYVGYTSREETVELASGEAFILNVDLSPSAGSLQTVVVSAGKFEQRIEDVTVSMAVLSPSQIDNLHTPSLESALEQVPGVSIIDGQANIRGGSGFSYGAGSRVMLLVDDLPMLAADANDVKWTFLPVENIEQVEVLKGASSALFGSSAMNGVINIRTAFPKSEPVTKWSAYHGNYDSPKNELYKWWGDIRPHYSGMRFFHSRRFNRLDFTVGSDMYVEEGYRQHEYEYRTRFNCNLRYRPARFDRITFGLNTNLYHTSGNLFLLWQDDSTGALKSAPGTLSGYTTQRKSFDPYFTYVSRKNETHKIRTRYFRTDNNNNTGQESFASWYYAEYQYQKKFSDKFTLTAGLADGYTEVSSELYGNHIANNAALYAQADASHLRWTFSAGGRVEKNRIDTARMDAIPVFRSGVNFRLYEHTHLRASFGQGYRFPSIAEKFIRTQVGSIVIYPNDSIRAENGFSAEAGVHQGFNLKGWKGVFDVAAFWSEYRDMMEFTFGLYGNPFTDQGFGLGFKSVNIGNTRIQGLDFTLLGEGYLGRIPLKVLAGFTIIYPISTTFDAAEDTLKYNTAKYNILKYRYRRTFKVDAESGYRKLTFGASLRYNSFMENIDLFFEEAIAGVKHFRQTHPHGDWVLDIRFFYRFMKYLDAGLIVKNLSNHEYVSRPAYLQPPRTYVVQLRAEF